MSILISGLILFFAAHVVPMRPALRTALRGKLGEMGYKVAFSLVSLIGFALIVYGYGEARMAGSPLLYDPPFWLRHVTMLVMVPVFVLLVAAYAPGGRIKAGVKHPMVLAVKIWAVAHLLANGDQASVLLFGAFLVWGIVDRIFLKRRGDIGGAAIAVPSKSGDVIAILAGLALYAAFIVVLHEWLIGVPVI